MNKRDAITIGRATSAATPVSRHALATGITFATSAGITMTGRPMSDRLRELEKAARAVCECAERGPMYIGPPDECRVVPRLIEDLRDALDAEPKSRQQICFCHHPPHVYLESRCLPGHLQRVEPEPSPTNKERAREAIASVARMRVFYANADAVIELNRAVARALAAAEARGLERAAELVWQFDDWSDTTEIVAAIRALKEE